MPIPRCTQVKIAGKNAFELFLPAMNASVKKRVSMETCCGALQNGEPLAHYQPKIDLMSGALPGFRKPCCAEERADGRHGVAGDFIPVAEDSGLIVPIGNGSSSRRWPTCAGGTKGDARNRTSPSTRPPGNQVDGIARRIAQSRWRKALHPLSG